MESKLIPKTNLYIKGKYDLLVKQADGTYLVVDFKITSPNEEKAAKYQTQLSKKDFLKKAPPQIVEKLKTDAAAAAGRAEKLQEKIKLLK